MLSPDAVGTKHPILTMLIAMGFLTEFALSRMGFFAFGSE
jgi:hypothetical protein